MSAIKFLGSIAATALLLTAGVASARDLPAAPLPAPTAAAFNPHNLSQRYCIVDSVTGTRIARRDCASLAEWQVRGVDPRKMRVLSGGR